MERSEVYKLIDGERDYQDKIWNDKTTVTGGIHSPEEWFMYIENYVNEAKHLLSRKPLQIAKPEAMSIMRKVGAMAVCAMEQLDCEPRK